jgi:hypothetical protein
VAARDCCTIDRNSSRRLTSEHLVSHRVPGRP